MCCISTVGKVLEPQEDDHQVGGAQRLEPGDVGAARLDESGLRVGREEHAALESVVPGEDPRQRRQRFLGAVLVVAGEKDDVLAGARALRAFVDDEVRIWRRERAAAGRERRTGSPRLGHDAYSNAQLPSCQPPNLSGGSRQLLSFGVGSWAVGELTSAVRSKGEPNRPLHHPRGSRRGRLAEVRVDLLAGRVELRVRVDGRPVDLVEHVVGLPAELDPAPAADWKFLKIDMFDSTIGGSRKNVRRRVADVAASGETAERGDVEVVARPSRRRVAVAAIGSPENVAA